MLLIRLTRLLPGFLLLFSLLLLHGCAYAPQMDKLDIEKLPFKPVSELHKVPFFPQQDYQCGPAALATVLNYRQLPVLPDDLVDKVYVPERQGSFQVEMVAATRQYGLLPYPIAPKMTDLFAEIDAGNPVLVLQNLAFDFYPQWHFAVVVGYDLPNSEVILRSATHKRWVTSLRNFEQTWRKSNYWGLVITRPDQIPVTADSGRWLASAYDLEQTNQSSAAKQAYLAASQRWPEQENVWLALSNFYYQQQQYGDALMVMNEVLLNFQQSSQMWNNYAYILRENGCYQAAKQAAACALKLAPGDSNILSTQQEMERLRGGSLDCVSIACD